MNQKIAVVTDSTAYIPPNALKDLNIPVIPLWVLWGEDRFRDGVDITPPDFYRRLQKSKAFPTTSQPSVGEFVDFFRRVADEAQTDTILGIYVSGKVSGTVASAEAAKVELPELNLTIIDSLLTSMAQGFVALTAARVAADGGSLEACLAAAQEVHGRMNLMFTVDTLEYLHRGGRIGGAKRFLGTALNIKPLLHMEEGFVEPLVQVRTKRKAIAQMLDIAEKRLNGKRMAKAAIIDANSSEEGDAIAEQVKERFGIAPVYRTALSPVIGTHAGPGTVGIAFYPEP